MALFGGAFIDSSIKNDKFLSQAYMYIHIYMYTTYIIRNNVAAIIMELLCAIKFRYVCICEMCQAC